MHTVQVQQLGAAYMGIGGGYLRGGIAHCMCSNCVQGVCFPHACALECALCYEMFWEFRVHGLYMWDVRGCGRGRVLSIRGGIYRWEANMYERRGLNVVTHSNFTISILCQKSWHPDTHP